jgi:hypothetical protein
VKRLKDWLKKIDTAFNCSQYQISLSDLTAWNGHRFQLDPLEISSPRSHKWLSFEEPDVMTVVSARSLPIKILIDLKDTGVPATISVIKVLKTLAVILCCTRR